MKATQDDIRLGLANGDVSNGHSLVYSQEDLGVIFNPMMYEAPDQLSVTVTSPINDDDNTNPIRQVYGFMTESNLPYMYKRQSDTTWNYVNNITTRTTGGQNGSNYYYYKYNDTELFNICFYTTSQYTDKASMSVTGPLIFKNVIFNFPKIETSLPC